MVAWILQVGFPLTSEPLLRCVLEGGSGQAVQVGRPMEGDHEEVQRRDPGVGEVPAGHAVRDSLASCLIQGPSSLVASFDSELR